MHVSAFIKMGEFLMRNKVIYYIFLCLYAFKFEKVLSNDRKIKNKIDPISDFRAPSSLFELLHEGLGKILQLCEELSTPVRSESASIKFSEIEHEIQLMHDTYAQIDHSSKLHMVYRNDKEFLQKLIDRIDTMIQDLQRSPHINSEEKNILKSSGMALNQFKNDL